MELALTPRVRRTCPDEIDLWSHTVGCGFFETAHLTTEEMDVGRAICAMPGALTYIAIDGNRRARRGGAFAIHEGLWPPCSPTAPSRSFAGRVFTAN